ERKGGLDLRLVHLMKKGGESGPAIQPGSADDSYLVNRLESGEMPPGDAKLSPKEIAVIQTWINQGAKTARPEPADPGPAMLITLEDREHWAFRPISRPAVPRVSGEQRTPIDAFLLSAMKTKGLNFSPVVEK